MATATALDMATGGDLMRMQLVLAKFVHLVPLLVYGWLELKKKTDVGLAYVALCCIKVFHFVLIHMLIFHVAIDMFRLHLVETLSSKR